MKLTPNLMMELTWIARHKIIQTSVITKPEMAARALDPWRMRASDYV